MGKKKNAVEGLTLDLGDLTTIVDECNWEDYIIREDPPIKKKRIDVTKNAIDIAEQNDAIIKQLYSCHYCNQMQYILHHCKDIDICSDCYCSRTKCLTDKISEYIRSECNNQCAFCMKEYSQNSRFHFDHINMFSKEDTIGLMIKRLEDIDTILDEAKKCQLLCYSCHYVVTKLEVNNGFIKAKTKLTRRSKKGEDITADNEKLYKEYETVMYPYYEKIKHAIQRTSCATSE